MIFWIDNSIPEDQLERTFFGTMISLVARIRDHFYHREMLLTCIRIWAGKIISSNTLTHHLLFCARGNFALPILGINQLRKLSMASCVRFVTDLANLRLSRLRLPFSTLFSHIASLLAAEP